VSPRRFEGTWKTDQARVELGTDERVFLVIGGTGIGRLRTYIIGQAMRGQYQKARRPVHKKLVG